MCRFASQASSTGAATAASYRPPVTWPCRARLRRRSWSWRRRSRAAASASTSPQGVNSPSTPSVMTSAGPPGVLATTAQRAHRPCTTTCPNGSGIVEACTRTSASTSQAHGSWTCPTKCTRSAMPSSAASASGSARTRPRRRAHRPTTKASAGEPSNALAKARRKTSCPFHGDSRASMTTRRTSSPGSWKSRGSRRDGRGGDDDRRPAGTDRGQRGAAVDQDPVDQPRDEVAERRHQEPGEVAAVDPVVQAPDHRGAGASSGEPAEHQRLEADRDDHVGRPLPQHRRTFVECRSRPVEGPGQPADPTAPAGWRTPAPGIHREGPDSRPAASARASMAPLAPSRSSGRWFGPGPAAEVGDDALLGARSRPPSG